jgi:hypothetical protein
MLEILEVKEDLALKELEKSIMYQRGGIYILKRLAEGDDPNALLKEAKDALKRLTDTQRKLEAVR